ncbi:sensor domain-containing diguanylate cyclase [Alkalispirochaeta sphaeroplastigenens]|uniref:sensor domain-containing diguanylate cyclase n=1 Tax=Alkalispirochaeta sphaeroplastigenens TaxID=1187066 RepID=UPI0011AF7AFD|nr:diguanylate cyclase [Alkalispirochaeta sphaeroplastigenens]
MIETRFFAVISLSVILGFFALTGFHALQEGERTREFIRDHELRPLGMAVAAHLDRTAAQYHRAGEELLRDGFLRDWILRGEEDEEELRAFLEGIRIQFTMIDVSIVSDRTETFYSTDGRTLVLDRDNHERDSWYYLYRDILVETNIDAWYDPEKAQLVMWVNVPILDRDGSFLGVTGGGVLAEDFTRTLLSFGQLPGVNVYMARHDGRIVYAGDPQLVRSRACLDDLWGIPVRDLLARNQTGEDYMVLEPRGVRGPLVWTSHSGRWSTYLALEKTGEVVAARTRATVHNSLLTGGILTIFFSVVVLLIVRGASSRIQEQSRRLEELAGQDWLTGLNNRLRFNTLVQSELARTRRTGEPAVLVLLDLDHFKNINDTCGHPGGDAVLVGVARVIREHLRSTDHAGRFGGEEFALLLPGTTPDGAVQVAEKIRRAITGCAPPGVSPLPPVTASFGVAPLRAQEGVSDEDLFHRVYTEADQALYLAKQRGRNRVETAPERT